MDDRPRAPGRRRPDRPEAKRQYHARAITLCALTCLDVRSAELVHRDGAVATRGLLDEAFPLFEPITLVD